MKKNWPELAARLHDERSPESITQHYLLEKSLAGKLMAADQDERRHLYGEVYDALYEGLPDHPLHGREPGGGEEVTQEVKRLERLVAEGSRFAEIGAGDGRVALAMARRCSKVYAFDVTEVMLVPGDKPASFSFIKFGGLEIPLPDGSIDFAYSNQVMEHLHPEDALLQLQEIARILTPGGAYYCNTPSRYTGPHDISWYFDDEPTGFHLKEYDYRSLAEACEEAGLSAEKAYVGGRFVPFPMAVLVEQIVAVAPRRVLQKYAHTRLLKSIFGIHMIIRKRR